METRLYSKDTLRVTTNHDKSIWLNIKSGTWEQSLEVSFYTSNLYIEVRKKEGQICSFYFESKRHKRDYDFGWWEDSEVVFANNDVQHK